jgi:hypothetical protein
MRSFIVLAAFAIATIASPLAKGVHAGIDPVAKCKDAKAKLAGRDALDLLTALGRNTKKRNVAKLSADVSKTRSRLTKGFVRAEAKGDCATTNDVANIEALVDGFVDDVVSDLCPPAPASTTSTTTPASTSTTIPNPTACDDTFPVCDGDCPAGLACGDIGLSRCGCVPVTGTPCGSAASPSCLGDCPLLGGFCLAGPFGCACQ